MGRNTSRDGYSNRESKYPTSFFLSKDFLTFINTPDLGKIHHLGQMKEANRKTVQ